MSCRLCPRKCGVNRSVRTGYCGQSDKIRIARVGLHMWEEPCISGERGSGTVFFSGCTLGCCFCQNYEISQLGKGYFVTEKELSDAFLRLRDDGAHNINLVSPTPFIPSVIRALDAVKHKLGIPVVVNCGGYELCETVEMMNGYADIWLPDLKYFSPEASKKYSGAEDYFDVAIKAIEAMQRQVGKPVFSDDGLLKRGVIVRHLLLPTLRHDSERVIRELGKVFPADGILLSLMSQYTPMYKAAEHREINRRVSTFEYNYVLGVARETGFDGYSQERSAAQEEFVPRWEGETDKQRD